jgi:hypothetical protein
MTDPALDALIEIVVAISQRLPDSVAEPLREQLRSASVVSEAPGRSIDLSIPADAPQLPAPDGPLPVSPSVLDEKGALTGEVLIWIKAGRLIGLERPWFTDDPPNEWPSTTSLDFTKQ